VAELEHGKYCYYIPPDQTPHPKKGFRVAIVNANEDGYRWTGDEPEGGLKMPWYWGHTLAEAELVCKKQNEDKLGLSELQSFKIITESMSHLQGRRRRKK